VLTQTQRFEPIVISPSGYYAIVKDDAASRLKVHSHKVVAARVFLPVQAHSSQYAADFIG
jgi:hypothetical protein